MKLIPWAYRDTWWDSLQDLEQLQDDINKIFHVNSVGACRNVGLQESNWAPPIDVYNSHDNIKVKADIPGMNKEDIDVTIHNDTLTIKGKKKNGKDVKEGEYLRTERFYGDFSRTLTLPSEVDSNKVNATYKNGVLLLVLPKKEEVKPKHIEVNVN